MQSFQGFLFRLLAFALVISLLHYLVLPYIPERFRFGPFLFLQLFFVLTTLAFHLGLLRAAANSDKAFVRYFMGATGMKMFLYLTVMFVFALMNRSQAVPFILNFFVLYVLYSGFEVALVYRKFGAIAAAKKSS